MYSAAEDDAVAPAVGPDGEPLDDGEAFDLQQMERVIAEDPESLAFHNARKVLAATKVPRCAQRCVVVARLLTLGQGSLASKTKRK
jgi:hypothetical protein